MTVEDLFGLAVRLAGLVFIVFSLFDGFHLVAALGGVPLSSGYPMPMVLAGAALWLVLGFVFLLGADAITRFTYRKRRNSN